MAAAGSGRRARKRPRGDAGQPAPEPAQDGKELSAWQIADLPAAQSKLKRGVWSKAEDDLLRDLFNAECDARGMDEEAKKDVILDSVNKHKAEGQGRFWVNISKHFTSRSIRSLRARAQRLLHPHSYRGKFSDEDIKELRHLVGIHGPKWKKIAQMMQRHPLVVRETYKAHAPGILHGPWSTSEEERLLSVMKEQGHVEKPGAVRIHWPAVASAVKSRCEAQCMSKWYSSFGLRERKHVWTPYADAVLLAHVVDDGEESWDHVDWHGVAAGVVHLLSSTGLAAADCRRRFRALCLRATKLVSRDVAALADKVEAYLRQTFEDPTLLDRARADAGLGSSGLGSSDPDTASDASASPATKLPRRPLAVGGSGALHLPEAAAFRPSPPKTARGGQSESLSHSSSDSRSSSDSGSSSGSSSGSHSSSSSQSATDVHSAHGTASAGRRHQAFSADRRQSSIARKLQGDLDLAEESSSSSAESSPRPRGAGSKARGNVSGQHNQTALPAQAVAGGGTILDDSDDSD